jgi:hypothetical protein
MKRPNMCMAAHSQTRKRPEQHAHKRPPATQTHSPCCKLSIHTCKLMRRASPAASLPHRFSSGTTRAARCARVMPGSEPLTLVVRRSNVCSDPASLQQQQQHKGLACVGNVCHASRHAMHSAQSCLSCVCLVDRIRTGHNSARTQGDRAKSYYCSNLPAYWQLLCA